MGSARTLAQAANAVLIAATPDRKLELTQAAVAEWRDGQIREIGQLAPPNRPGRPTQPPLVPPRDVPRRRITASSSGRVALLHAIAHIELNAIDLAWDLIARFTDQKLPRAFYDDWTSVASDEARHFGLLQTRLAALGAAYGELPAHDGLWEAAEATAGDLLARLAIVPLVLEARGLDVTPGMIKKLEEAGDYESSEILKIICEEEIEHVAAGQRWFEFVCHSRGQKPTDTWPALVRMHFRGIVKPPFNHDARQRAGMVKDLYAGLT